MRQGSILHRLAIAAACAGVLALGACGGNGGSGVNSNPPSSGGGDSPTVISGGDAPMSSVLAALVTVSAVSATSSSGAVQLLNQPRQIELTHLGGIRAPLDLHPLPQGTYTSLSITVSAAQITYIDPTSNQVVVADATIPAASATQTITLTNPLVVNDTGATDIRFDFDLQKSLDLTGSTVTFTPAISAAAARVQGESSSDRVIYINGTVTATTGSTITLQTDDSGLSVTLNTDNNTKFDDSLTLANIQVGAALDTEDQLQSDGTLTALVVEDANGGATVDSNSRVDNGVVVATTRDPDNTLTAFTMVVRNSTKLSEIGKVLTVDIGAGSTFIDTLRAQNAGFTTFDQTQVFPGAGVWLTGTISGSETVVARGIRPAAVNPFGLTSAAVQTGTSGGYVLTLLLDNKVGFFNNIGTLTVDTNSNTVFDGAALTSATVANLSLGTPLVARGFLSLNGTSNLLYCAHLHEEGSSYF